MAIVYRHIRNDNSKVFYIGIELDSDKRKAIGLRSNKKTGRSKFWSNVANKVGYKIEIIHKDISNDLAKQIEIYLINFYGRKDLNLGSLVNLTNGGDGAVCKITSDETKIKLSNVMKGRHKGEKNPMFGKNPYKDKIHYASKKIININTGEIYNTITEVYKKNNIKKTTFLRWLKNENLNKTSYRYL